MCSSHFKGEKDLLAKWEVVIISKAYAFLEWLLKSLSVNLQTLVLCSCAQGFV